jgi:hypothetical protein
VLPEQLGWYREPNRPWFARSSLAIWQLGQSDAPKFLGPDYSVLYPDQSSSFVGTVLIDDEPVKAFATERRQGVLRRLGERYVLDQELTIAPGSSSLCTPWRFEKN